jgi:hypothetical protein
MHFDISLKSPKVSNTKSEIDVFFVSDEAWVFALNTRNWNIENLFSTPIKSIIQWKNSNKISTNS